MTEAAAVTSEAPEETIEQIGARIFAEDKPPTAAAVEAPPAPEPAKDPAAERASARILANQRAEQRAAKQRAEIAAARAELEKDKAAIEEAKALKAQLDEAIANPHKFLEMSKRTPRQLLEQLAEYDQPEAVAKRAVEGTLTEVQKLQARIDAMEKADADRLRAQRERELAVEEQQTGAAFVDFIASNVEKYPNLVEVMDPNEMVQAGFALLHEVIGKDAQGRQVTRLAAWMAEHDGNPPDDTDIAEALEERATPRAKARSEWRTRIGKNAPAASTATTSVDVRATQTDRGPSPRTLTSRAASERASAPPSKELSQEEKDAECIRIIEASLKAG